jgi:hypothetical protein
MLKLNDLNKGWQPCKKMKCAIRVFCTTKAMIFFKRRHEFQRFAWQNDLWIQQGI